LAHSIPSQELTEIRAGDTATWTKSLSDYPPASWTLYYALVKDDAQETITASDNGDGTHLVEVAPTATDDWGIGTYFLQGYVESAGGARHTVYEGYLEVKAGLHLSGYSSGHETRSTVKRTLDALEAVILGKASKDQLNYTIAGRSLSHHSPAELLEWRREYRRLWRDELAALDREAGKSPKRHVKLQPTKAS